MIHRIHAVVFVLSMSRVLLAVCQPSIKPSTPKKHSRMLFIWDIVVFIVGTPSQFCIAERLPPWAFGNRHAAQSNHQHSLSQPTNEHHGKWQIIITLFQDKHVQCNFFNTNGKIQHTNMFHFALELFRVFVLSTWNQPPHDTHMLWMHHMLYV